MNRKRQILYYVLADYLSACIAFAIFFIYRKYHTTGWADFNMLMRDVCGDWKFYADITLIPLCWLVCYGFGNSYRKIFRKSRLKEFEYTFKEVLFGTLLLFFFIILDDVIVNYQDYIRYFLMLFALQFGWTYLFRFVIISITNSRIHRGKLHFNTILVGGGKDALRYYHALQQQRQPSGTALVGFVTSNGEDTSELSALIPNLGTYRDLPELIKAHGVQEIVVAVGDDTRAILGKIFPNVDPSSSLQVKIFPHTGDFVMGTVNSTAVYHEPLIEMQLDFMPLWQRLCKRIADIIGSLVCMVLCLPLYIFLAVGVRCSSPGPILFRQERDRGKPFHIIKFRSMYVDAEADGPQLSSVHDSRITHFGVFMRKTHLDEIPQFFNVFRGEMSLVGPRPERQYYIDQIVKKAPHYRLLQLIKPGLTSWGQVTYGYAENVDQMVERLRYDIMYLENMTLLMDIKILIYTVLAVIKQKGK